jgi:hypothetical protein
MKKKSPSVSFLWRFVKGSKEPITLQEKKHTGWQEVCRKDVERAFKVLKGTW